MARKKSCVYPPFQNLEVQKLRLLNFNDFDGVEVANLLSDHAELWDGFILAGGDYQPLAPLRDIHTDEEAHYDTMWLKTTVERVGDLTQLLRRAKASEVGHIDGTGRVWVGVPGGTDRFGTFDLVNQSALGLLGHNPRAVIVRAFWD